MEMKLTYIAIHTAKPERMKDFYVKYLGAVADEPRPAGKDGQEADTGLADSTFGGTVYNLSFEGGVKIRLIPERPVICDALSSVSLPQQSYPPLHPPYPLPCRPAPPMRYV